MEHLQNQLLSCNNWKSTLNLTKKNFCIILEHIPVLYKGLCTIATILVELSNVMQILSCVLIFSSSLCQMLLKCFSPLAKVSITFVAKIVPFITFMEIRYLFYVSHCYFQWKIVLFYVHLLLFRTTFMRVNCKLTDYFNCRPNPNCNLDFQVVVLYTYIYMEVKLHCFRNSNSWSAFFGGVGGV